MDAKNISISDEAYARLAAFKKDNESFTDVVNRLTGKRSILELAGLLTESEGESVERSVVELKEASGWRVEEIAKRVAAP